MTVVKDTTVVYKAGRLPLTHSDGCLPRGYFSLATAGGSTSSISEIRFSDSGVVLLTKIRYLIYKKKEGGDNKIKKLNFSDSIIMGSSEFSLVKRAMCFTFP